MKKLTILFTFALIFALSMQISNAQGWVKTVVAVTGNILDHVTKEPVSAKITAYDETGKKVNSTKSNSYENGYYYMPSLSAGKTYQFVIELNGYLLEKVEVKIAPSDKYLEVSRDFVIKPNNSDVLIKLPTSPFELHKSKLRFGSGIVLDDMANTLVNNPKVNFAIVSFPDNSENATKNQELTTNRSQSLMDYFVIKGIDPDRIQVEGSSKVDDLNPPPTGKQSKGKRYIGPTYIKILK